MRYLIFAIMAKIKYLISDDALIEAVKPYHASPGDDLSEVFSDFHVQLALEQQSSFARDVALDKLNELPRKLARGSWPKRKTQNRSRKAR